MFPSHTHVVVPLGKMHEKLLIYLLRIDERSDVC